ncbi:uroporphyrin-III C-methyltransferase [Pseudomonas sp. BAY1663]|nr:uroporphyrin-III C-methyltransferase [Pseudomonas sp. BAY1663]
MSEADSKKDPLQPPASEPTPAVESVQSEPSKPAAGGPGKALAALALLVGVGAIALGGYSLWQLQQLGAQEDRQLQALQGASEQTRQLAASDQQLAARLGRLEQLPSAAELEERRRLLAVLQSDQQRLSGRVEQVLGASREQWRLAEAEHLLRMAMLQLSAMQDVKSAEMLVHEADLILQKQDDPSAYATRQKLLEGWRRCAACRNSIVPGCSCSSARCAGRAASSAPWRRSSSTARRCPRLRGRAAGSAGWTS